MTWRHQVRWITCVATLALVASTACGLDGEIVEPASISVRLGNEGTTDRSQVTLRLDAGMIGQGCDVFPLRLTQATVDNTLRINVNGYRLPPGAENCIEAQVPEAYTVITLSDEWLNTPESKQVVIVMADIENVFELSRDGDTLLLSEIAVDNARGGGEASS